MVAEVRYYTPTSFKATLASFCHGDRWFKQHPYGARRRLCSIRRACAEGIAIHIAHAGGQTRFQEAQAGGAEPLSSGCYDGGFTWRIRPAR